MFGTRVIIVWGGFNPRRETFFVNLVRGVMDRQGLIALNTYYDIPAT